jgi:acid stress-induced BolA-like protein IbaG/YrbA
MLTELVRDKILEGFPDGNVTAQGDGSRMQIAVVSAAFGGKSRVVRQQLVYACINDLIREGTLHAVTISALSPEEAPAEGTLAEGAPADDATSD